MMQLETPPLAADTGPYRRNTWQEAVAQHFPPHRRTARLYRWIDRGPVLIIVVVMSFLSLLLRNGAMIDEALYINAGTDYLKYWTDGTPVPDHGAVLSGSPALYPVLAGVLNTVGGLWLVRLFSLVCMVVAVLAVERLTVRMTGSRRTGLLAAAVFGFSAPVAFLGGFATFDAATVMLLAVGMAVGVSPGRDLSRGAAAGALLAAAVAVKYTSGVFAVAAVAVILFAVPYAWRRAMTAAAVCGTILGGLYLLWGDSVAAGIRFTTTSREALTPADPGVLFGLLLLNVAGVVLLGLWGSYRYLRPVAEDLSPGQRRTVWLPLVLLATSMALPAAQIRMGEGTSFLKHTVFVVLFLAPLAGVALASISRGTWKLGPVLLLVGFLLFIGFGRSQVMYQEWVDVSPALAVVEESPAPGPYLSSSADVLKYYTAGEHPDMQWEATFSLYPEGADVIREKVDQARWQMVIVRTASTGDPDQDVSQRELLRLLQESPEYQLVTDVLPVAEGSSDQWVIYRKTDQ